MHPVVERLQPNPDQTPAIISRRSNIVVTAGAGTGKTLTLVARYLALLADGMNPRQIAAITFTRKAAREMRNRVRRAIDIYLRQESDELDDGEMWRDHFAALDAARIGTIHSLCSEILRAHPAEAAIDPRFTTLEEADAALLQVDVMDEALSWAATTDGFQLLFLLFGERGLRDILSSLLSQRARARAVLHDLPAEPLAHWQSMLRTRQKETLNGALRDATLQHAIDVLLANAPLHGDDRMAEQRQMVLSAYDALQEAESWPERRQALQALDAINLQGGRQNSWPEGKEQLQEVKEALRAMRTWWREISTLQNLELNESDQRLALALPLLGMLYDQAEAAYNRGLQQRRALDFDDLEYRALQLLREHEAVSARWRGDIRAILVDEYQDTNGRQRDLINLLNGDEQKLFIVGDAKQSIYRFRGAEISVFRQERRRIAQTGRAIDLRQSYRAHDELITALNLLLRPVLGEEDDQLREWQEPFAPLVAVRHEPLAGLAAPWCELHLCTGSKSQGALVRAAEALAARLSELIQDPAGTLQFGDIAILCQASTSFAAYEDALDRAGIPYVTVAGRGFFERPEIRDLLNALQAIAEPHDDLALVGLLRSPVIGLSDGNLLHLMDAYRGSGAPSLWRWLLGGSGDTPIPETVLVDPRRLVERLQARAGRLSVADILKEFLDATGYRAMLRLAGEVRSLRNVDKLLETAHSTGFVSTSDFLQYMTVMSRGLSREGEARVSGENAVQIMTIHQAKGLEFPVVVIGDISYQPPLSPRYLLDDEFGFVARLRDAEDDPAVFSLALARETSQQNAESARLLYVAATRARDKLLINGVVSTNNSGALSGQRGWLGMLESSLGLRGFSPDFGDEGDRVVHIPLEISTTIAGAIYGPRVQPPPATPDAQQIEAPAIEPDIFKLVDPLHNARIDEPQASIPNRWQIFPESATMQRPAHMLGNLVHDAIRTWKIPASESDSRFRQWLQTYARQTYPLERLPEPWLITQATTLLVRFSRHDFFSTLSRARRRLHEVPFIYRDESGLHEGRIDVLFLDDAGWHVVDFKTDAIHSRTPLDERIRQRFRPQLQRYSRAVRRLVGAMPQCHVCLLDVEGRVHVETMDIREN